MGVSVSSSDTLPQFSGSVAVASLVSAVSNICVGSSGAIWSLSLLSVVSGIASGCSIVGSWTSLSSSPPTDKSLVCTPSCNFSSGISGGELLLAVISASTTASLIENVSSIPSFHSKLLILLRCCTTSDGMGSGVQWSLVMTLPVLSDRNFTDPCKFPVGRSAIAPAVRDFKLFLSMVSGSCT